MASKGKKFARYRVTFDAEMLGVVRVVIIARRGSHTEKILDKRVCVDRDRVKSDREARRIAKATIIADSLANHIPRLRE